MENITRSHDYSNRTPNGKKALVTARSLECCLIGDDTLLISCAEVLLNKGHKIVWIVSVNQSINRWANEHNIPRFDSILDLGDALKNQKIDYLFSIANGKILQEQHIRLPQKLAINYHYSLLPKYAGTYATSWAILNDEKTHGVTWHVMTKEIDGGDILKQKKFPIDKNETALTLNLKCFEYAIQTFTELVSELECDKYILKKQDLTLRNYSPLRKRPPQNGVINWNKSAYDIHKLHRALTFGNYFNQLGILKLKIGTEVFHVQEVRVLTVRSIAAPGTVISILSTELQISTTTFDVVISKFYTLEGTPILFSELIRRFKITVGYQFPIPEQSYFEQLEQFAEQYVKYENYWLDALTKIILGKEPFFANSTNSNSLNLKQATVTKIPKSIYEGLMIDEMEGVRRQDILLASILVYLYRLNGCDNFSAMYTCPGVSLANTAFEQYYMSKLPLTLQFSPFMNFREALKLVIKQLGSLKKNQTYSRDICLRYPQLTHSLDLNLISIEVTDNIKTYQPKQSPLSVVIAKDGSEISVFIKENIFSLEYLSALISHFSSHILALLTDAIKNPDQKISKLKLLTVFENKQLLIDWNETAVPIKEGETVHKLFEDQVLKTPNHMAIIFKDEGYTFEVLNQKANQLAHYLKRYNISSGKLIAICAERSLEMVVAILAVLKVGGVYIPLDPKYPIDRLSYMLEDSNAEILLLNHDSLKDNLQSYKGHIVDLANERHEISGHINTNPRNISTQNSLAYVIYTSGTTGNPKGVAISHAALVNHMLWMIKKFNFTERDTFLQKTPFSFDASIWEFFAPLLTGAKLVMASEGDPTEIISLTKKHRVTILQTVPSLLRQFLEDVEFQTCDSLQQVFSGGEALLPSTVQLFFKKMSAKLHNLYGPTETTIQVTTHSYNISDGTKETIFIGKPINNTQVYVLDAHLNLMPVGLTGELYIGGLCLAKGYLNRDDLTSARFIKNPFNKEIGSRLYKTGDMVRWLPQGELEYIGRLDEQVKFNGFRIELSEIEATLLQHESIRDCAVLVQERSGNNDNVATSKSLVAYYVKKHNVTPSETKDFVKTWESLYETQYSLLDNKNFKNNIKGWDSSYTDRAINEEQMFEWVNNTTDRIKLYNPRTILEIGSGSGLILFNILDSCRYYYATDFSRNVINYTNEILRELQLKDKVFTVACSADELPYNEFKKPYDTVVINSVIQYFPNLEYLENVVLSVISNMMNSGQIFIGDIRDFRLLKIFHYSVLSYKRQQVVQSEVDYFALRDKELLISPEYFIYLQEKNHDISHVEILPKLGIANHEMNNYRYDVILHIKKNHDKTNSININEEKFVEVLNFENYVNDNVARSNIYIKYPNVRIAKDYLEYNKICNIDPKNNDRDFSNLLSIHQMIAFANVLSFKAKFFIDISDPLYLFVVLSRDNNFSQQNTFIEYNIRKFTTNNNFANNPLNTEKHLENQFSNELKSFMSQKLPSYMIPSRYIPLNKMPLNINGKIDKAALVEPKFIRSEEYLAPRNEIESKVCQIWAQVLGLPEDNIGIQDDFFTLGGHSLSALRALSLAKKLFSIQFPTRTFFEYPTIEKLAAFIQQAIENPAFISQQNLMASPLIALQKDGFKAPLFMIHPLGGTIFWYKALSRYLGNNRPIYAIQDPGIQANELLFKNLEEMASFYLKVIQEIQPTGPYLIAGASFGGTVSIEIANQLLKSKEIVNFVGLLDAWPMYSEKFWEKDFLEKLMLRQFQRMNSQFISQDIYNLDFLLNLHQHRASMLRDYKLPIIDTRLTFFKAKELWPIFKEMVLPLNCWQPYSTKPVDIQLVSGNHETMFWEPQVQLLAKKINLALEKSENQRCPVHYGRVVAKSEISDRFVVKSPRINHF